VLLLVGRERKELGGHPPGVVGHGRPNQRERDAEEAVGLAGPAHRLDLLFERRFEINDIELHCQSPNGTS